jgi:serine/threonine protein kinase
MGDVWRARDKTLHRPVALKDLRPGLLHDHDSLTRFAREARVLASLDDHGFATVFDVGEDDLGPFIVMELVEGESLETILDREGRLPPARVAEIGASVAATLHVAHEAGFVHRDIKPGNIMLGHDGSVRVLDFGVAQAAGWTPLTGRRSVHGTPEYLSPEQARGEALDGRSDIFSLGVVLLEALGGGSVEGLQGTPPALARAIARCMRPRPRDRYVDALQLRRDLNGALAGITQNSGEAVTGRLRRASPTLRLPRTRLKAALFVGTAIMVGGLGLFIPGVMGQEKADSPPDEPPLLPPEAVTVDSTCSGFTLADVTLRWEPPRAGAEGYVVYRSAEGGVFERAAVVREPLTSAYVDEDLETEMQYTYEIRSVAGAGESEPSDSVTIGTPVLCLW